MEAADSQTTSISSINISLEIRIKDFRTASKSSKKGNYIEHCDDDFNAWFSVSAFPNGFDEETEGWLVVRPFVTVLRGKYRPRNSMVSLVVSVIDIEGNTRFPRSFTQNLSKDVTNAKYFERSFFLNRAEDFLPENVLTLRCDICFQWYNPTSALAPESHSTTTENIIRNGTRYDPKLTTNDSDIGDSIDDYADFVTKNKILTEVLYLADLGKVSAIYDPPSSKGRHPKAWSFCTRTENFNVILDEERNNIGTRFLKASPVIRRCVNTPMKERQEKRIEFPNADGKTFKNVVYFLVNGTLPKFEFDEILEIYEFSHLYELELLQRNCAEDIVNCFEHEDNFKELLKFADFYSDEYLSGLLNVRRDGSQNLETELPNLRMNDKPYSDCYI